MSHSLSSVGLESSMIVLLEILQGVATLILSIMICTLTESNICTTIIYCQFCNEGLRTIKLFEYLLSSCVITKFMQRINFRI